MKLNMNLRIIQKGKLIKYEYYHLVDLIFERLI